MFRQLQTLENGIEGLPSPVARCYDSRFMRSQQSQLLLNLVLQRISEEQFLREVGIAPEGATGFVLKHFEEAFCQKSAEDVEMGLYAAFRFGLKPEFLDVLIRLSDADWHQRHEDVVTALQELHDTRAVEALYRAAFTVLPYREYDDYGALSGKAIWALGELGDETADQKLRLLAESDNLILQGQAREQLYRRSGLQTREEGKRINTLFERIEREKDQTIREQLLREVGELIEQQRSAEQKWVAEQGWRTTPR
jgi:hypothetical protein